MRPKTASEWGLAFLVLVSLISCSGGGGGGAAGGDTIAPTVSSTTPGSNATGVAVNAALAVTFSEAMDPATITAASITLDHGAAGAVTYDATNHIATLTPSADLAHATTYRATIAASVKDAAGNAMAAEYAWSFTTGAAPDTTAPTISSTNPASGDANVAANASITAAFSEAMDSNTLTVSTFTLKDNGGASVNGTVTYAGTTATFDPAAILAYSTTYTATITTGVKDLAGNALAADKTWSFTTGAAPDLQAPVVTATNPADNARGVAVTTKVTATFSEAMNQSTLTTANMKLAVAVDGSPVLGTVAPAALSAEFSPLANLEPGTLYRATITTGVQDLAGNALAADKAWNFATPSTAPTPTFGMVSGDTVARHGQPVIAFNNAGNGIAVWVEYSGTSYRLLYAPYTGGWQPEAELDSGDIYNIYSNVVSDGTGFMLVYMKNYEIFGRRFDGNASPVSGSPDVIKSKAAYTTSSVPAVASAGPGSYAATWMENDNGPGGGGMMAFGSIYSGGTWSPPVQINNPVDGAVQGEVRVASNGTSYGVAWTQWDGARNNVHANISSGGTWTFSTAALLESGDGDAWYHTRIASDGSGYAVVWRQHDGTYYSIYANASVGGAWSTTNAMLVESNSFDANMPVIASRGANDYMVAWQQIESDITGVNRVYANASFLAEGLVYWNAGQAKPLGVATLTNTYNNGPGIVSVGTGTYAVVWPAMDGERIRLKANIFSSPTDSTQDASFNIDSDTSTGNATEPQITKTNIGFAAVWGQKTNTSASSIFSNHLYSGLQDGAAEVVYDVGVYRGASDLPAVAVNKYGEVLAVWLQYNAGLPGASAYHYAYGRLLRDGAWSSPFRLADYIVTSIDVATNGTDFLVAYTYPGEVIAQTCSRAGVVGAQAFLRDPLKANGVYGVKIASNGLGYAVAWHQMDGGHDSLFANIASGPTLSWSGAQLLESSSLEVSNFSLASNGSGYALAWNETNGSTGYYVFARAWDSSSWGTAAAIDDTGTARDPAIASNGTGYAVAWRNGSDTRGNVFTSLTSTTKDGYQFLSSGNPNYPMLLGLASNGTGYATAWQQHDGSGYRIYANAFTNLTATTKDAVVRLSDISSNAIMPRIASNGTGYAAEWIQSNSLFMSTFDGSAWSAQSELDAGSEPVDQPMITSNGSTYSSVWLQRNSTDALVYDAWSRIGH